MAKQLQDASLSADNKRGSRAICNAGTATEKHRTMATNRGFKTTKNQESVEENGRNMATKNGFEIRVRDNDWETRKVQMVRLRQVGR